MIELRNVSIRAGNYRLPNISFRVETGKYAVVMGKTGIGKTTILESVCGLRKIERGNIMIRDVDVTDWPPADRNLGYVPQDLALFPTMTVRQHLEFAMRLRRFAKVDCNSRIAELSDLLGIRHLLERGVRNLSGGEAQRVALGRALSFQPNGLILDEPMSALDADTRHATQELLREINRRVGITVLHVTHNAEEAAALADMCIRLSTQEGSGEIQVSLE